MFPLERDCSSRNHYEEKLIPYSLAPADFAFWTVIITPECLTNWRLLLVGMVITICGSTRFKDVILFHPSVDICNVKFYNGDTECSQFYRDLYLMC